LKIHFRTKLLVVFLLVLLTGGCLSAPDNNDKGISKAVLNLIDQAVFEIVVKKPFDSPDTKAVKIEENREEEIFEDIFTYEKELPWESLDYSSRTDEYSSIGTAFAISENKLATAAHVLNLENETLVGDYYIRDKSGNVYELESIEKYANNRDFVIFTAQGMDSMKHFDLEFDYELNSNVYAVGNALGEGIIIRDGLLTSSTKETENGEWEYLRYSAAASPGNSGGPLLNKRGKVLGIVLKKSENENLNYALPISEAISASENIALYHFFGNYGISISQKKYGPVKYTKTIDLPLGYKELRSKLSLLYKNSNQLYLNKLLLENELTMFPFGEGSYRLLHNTNSFSFPNIAAENKEDGIWSIYQPKDIEKARLKDNGFVSYGAIAEFTALQFRKPLNISLQSLMVDSEFFIETFLKAYPLNRYIGNNPTRITSLGSAVETENFEDRYGRTWYVQTWNIGFADSKLVIYSMAVPSGFVAFALLNTIGAVDQVQSLDMKEYLNYVFFSYKGTFLEWKEYLELDIPKSDIFDNVEFSYSAGNEVFFKNPNFQIHYNKDLLSIDDKSNLTLRASYLIENDKPVWAPVGISFTNNFTGDNYIKLIKKTKPEISLTEDYHENWNNLLMEKYPFDGSAVINKQMTYADALQKQFSNENNQNREFLYFVEVGIEGTREKSDMEKYLDLLQNSITVTE